MSSRIHRRQVALRVIKHAPRLTLCEECLSSSRAMPKPYSLLQACNTSWCGCLAAHTNSVTSPKIDELVQKNNNGNSTIQTTLSANLDHLWTVSLKPRVGHYILMLLSCYWTVKPTSLVLATKHDISIWYGPFNSSGPVDEPLSLFPRRTTYAARFEAARLPSGDGPLTDHYSKLPPLSYQPRWYDNYIWTLRDCSIVCFWRLSIPHRSLSRYLVIGEVLERHESVRRAPHPELQRYFDHEEESYLKTFNHPRYQDGFR